MSNLTYKLAHKVLQKILHIHNAKVMIFKTEDNFKQYLDTREDLSIEDKLVMINEGHGCTTVYHEVLIKEYAIVNPNPVLRELAKIEILAHEYRHVWQLEHGWIFDNTLPYMQRAHEVDAYKFSLSVVTPIVIALGAGQLVLSCKVIKSIINLINKNNK